MRRVPAAPKAPPTELQQVREKLREHDAHLERVHHYHRDRAQYAWLRKTGRPLALDHYMALRRETMGQAPRSLAIQCDDADLATISMEKMTVIGVPGACAKLIARAQQRNL
jgi:hypothetical protein